MFSDYPNARKALYTVYAVLGVAIGAVQVGYTSSGAEQPTWLIVTLAVFGFLGTALGVTAASNTPTEE
jgi:hypothetical protein